MSSLAQAIKLKLQNEKISSELTEQSDPTTNSPLQDATKNRSNALQKIAKMDLTNIATSANPYHESAYHSQKTDYLTEANNREEEIRKFLYEPSSSDFATKRIGLTTTGKTTNRTSINFDVNKYMQSIKDEECTFQPKINPNTSRIANTKRQHTDRSINESLYQEAREKKARGKEQEAEEKQNLSKVANSNKISSNSIKIVLKKVEAALRNIIQQSENAKHPGSIDFADLGVILSRLGVFQNLEFNQDDHDPNQSSLSLNKSKMKPQRLSQEIAFHENLWKILTQASHDTELVPCEIIFKFLMTLVEYKTTPTDSSALLKEIMRLYCVQNNQEFDYDSFKTERELWDLEKLVVEFRKLFDDKTSYLNLYGPQKIVPQRKKSRDSFKPKINDRSKNLDMKRSNENYQEKTKSFNESFTSTGDLKTRYDALFEHHKYLNGKKQLYNETKKEKELSECTFKPQITEYKKTSRGGKTGRNSSLNQSMQYGDVSNQDLSNVKRYDLLYEVAKVQKEKLQQKAYAIKKQAEEKEFAECSFQPRLQTNRPKSPNLSPERDTAPKGYRKAIERLQVAEKLREESKAKKEYVSRGENYEKLKSLGPQVPSFLNRQKTQKKEALVYVDVNIAPGKTGRIGIHEGDDARTLANNFAKTYSINSAMRHSLEALLQSYIDSYFLENPQELAHQDGDVGYQEYQGQIQGQEREYYGYEDQIQEHEEEYEEEGNHLEQGEEGYYYAH